MAFSATSGTTLASGAFDVDPVAGDAVRVAVVGFENVSVSSVTDNAGGNTYSLVSGSRFYINGSWTEIWECDSVNTTSGFEVTVVCDGSAWASRGVCGIAIADAGATEVVGGQTQNPPPTSTDGTTTGTLATPSEDGHFIFAVTTGGASPDNLDPGTGFTAIGSYVYNQVWRVEYQIQATAAPVVGSFTQDIGGGTWATAAISVAPAGGGGSSPSPIFFGRRL